MFALPAVSVEMMLSFALTHLFTRPIQQGVQDWKDRIAIRTREEHSAPSDASTAQTLAPFLCYVCHTNATSKGSRPVAPLYPDAGDPRAVPLPFWTSHGLGTKLTKDDATKTRRMSEKEMQGIVQEFLLDE